METRKRPTEDPELVLDRELDVIVSAIGMVAIGASHRIAVTGLRFGSELLDAAQRLAAQADVRVRPVYGTDDSGCDLVVEPAPSPGDR